MKVVLIPRQELAKACGLVKKILGELNRVLIGRSELHKMVLTGILSRGHILLEGLPGVGKTALIRVLSQLLNLKFSRVQFTPDLMPGDILGSHILRQNTQGQNEMVFEPGPVFANILLADEINRASPKTQSALLEAMQESNVTIMGETKPLPKPFFVLASQNPIELEGTYPLPEAQLDRFLFKLEVMGADAETMREIIYSRRRGELPSLECSVSREELDFLFDIMNRIYLPKAVASYISRIVACINPNSKTAPAKVKEFVQSPASPRAAIAIAESARALALFDMRPSVGFEDVRAVAIPALNHRLLLNYKAKFEGCTAKSIIKDIIAEIKETEIDMADEITVEAAQ